jgi:hypothetical protein
MMILKTKNKGWSRKSIGEENRCAPLMLKAVV